jgi:uncharacterized protein YkwD
MWVVLSVIGVGSHFLLAEEDSAQQPQGRFGKLIESIKKEIMPEPLRGSLKPQESHLTSAGAVDQTNAFRHKHGLPALKESEELDEAAESKLNDMFSHQYFAHVSPTGEGISYWVGKVGYRYVAVGENLALGNFENDAKLVQSWINSPGHRENMLNSNFTEIGVAVGKGEFEGSNVWFAVQMLARPEGDCPQIDENLKKDIIQLQGDLKALEAEMAKMQARLKAPSGEITPEGVAKHNEQVSAYNRLVDKNNELAKVLKGKVAVYNQQVTAFNKCAGN